MGKKSFKKKSTLLLALQGEIKAINEIALYYQEHHQYGQALLFSALGAMDSNKLLKSEKSAHRNFLLNFNATKLISKNAEEHLELLQYFLLDCIQAEDHDHYLDTLKKEHQINESLILVLIALEKAVEQTYLPLHRDDKGLIQTKNKLIRTIKKTLSDSGVENMDAALEELREKVLHIIFPVNANNNNIQKKPIIQNNTAKAFDMMLAPQPAWFHIFSYLSLKDYQNISRVNKALHQLTKDFGQSQFQQLFPDQYQQLVNQQTSSPWYQSIVEYFYPSDKETQPNWYQLFIKTYDNFSWFKRYLKCFPEVQKHFIFTSIDWRTKLITDIKYLFLNMKWILNDSELSQLVAQNSNEFKNQTLYKALKQEYINFDYIQRICRALVGLGADINAEFEFEWINKNIRATLLHYYIYLQGHTLFLLDLGANPNKQDKNGNTALHLCINSEFVKKVLQKNIEAGINVNLKNSAGETLLHKCVTRFYDIEKNADLIDLLVAAKADINIKDQKGLTPLHYAVTVRIRSMGGIYEKETLQALLKYKPNVNLQDSGGNTALHLAAERQHLTFAFLLMQNGADIRIINNAGKTAADYDKRLQPFLKLYQHLARTQKKVKKSEQSFFKMKLDKRKFKEEQAKICIKTLCTQELPYSDFNKIIYNLFSKRLKKTALECDNVLNGRYYLS